MKLCKFPKASSIFQVTGQKKKRPAEYSIIFRLFFLLELRSLTQQPLNTCSPLLYFLANGATKPNSAYSITWHTIVSADPKKSLLENMLINCFSKMICGNLSTFTALPTGIWFRDNLETARTITRPALVLPLSNWGYLIHSHLEVCGHSMFVGPLVSRKCSLHFYHQSQKM